jgi:hypothetical protein
MRAEGYSNFVNHSHDEHSAIIIEIVDTVSYSSRDLTLRAIWLGRLTKVISGAQGNARQVNCDSSY